MRILALSGSLRRDSYNTDLLRLAAAETPPGVAIDVFEGLREVPPFDADEETAPGPAVVSLREAIGSADALLVATPEYNGSAPGVLKNALDWASRPAGGSALSGIPTAVVGASPGRFGAAWAQADLRKVLGIAGSRVVDVELAVAKAHDRLREPDDDLRADVKRVVDTLVQEGRALAEAA